MTDPTPANAEPKRWGRWLNPTNNVLYAFCLRCNTVWISEWCGNCDTPPAQPKQEDETRASIERGLKQIDSAKSLGSFAKFAEPKQEEGEQTLEDAYTAWWARAGRPLPWPNGSNAHHAGFEGGWHARDSYFASLQQRIAELEPMVCGHARVNLTKGNVRRTDEGDCTICLLHERIAELEQELGR